MSETDELRYWLALNRAPHVGPVTIQRLMSYFPSLQAVFSASQNELRTLGLKPRALEGLQAPDWTGVDADLAWLAQPEAHVIVFGDKCYPTLLTEIADPPPVLFIYGHPEVLALSQIAIVGSRNPTPMGRETAEDFARHLAVTGLTVTSGLALGIDAAAHEGALAAEGITVAVAGTGLDRVYPARHRDLAHRIAENGALVSEFPLGAAPLASHFPRRNRIISGLSRGVLVVEAALKSGSLITAQQALEQGREVFAVPGSVHNPLAKGCNTLIKQGAKLVESAADIFEEIPDLAITAQIEPSANTEVRPFELDEEYKKVLESVGYEPTPVDKVVERSGLTADSVCSMLLVLELQGLVASTSGGQYCLTG